MRISALASFLLALVVLVPAARADVVTEHATLSFDAASQSWSFLTDSGAGGKFYMVSTHVGKKLTKLKAAAPSHTCNVTYDTDAKIEVPGVSYLALYNLSKCD